VDFLGSRANSKLMGGGWRSQGGMEGATGGGNEILSCVQVRGIGCNVDEEFWDC